MVARDVNELRLVSALRTRWMRALEVGRVLVWIPLLAESMTARAANADATFAALLGLIDVEKLDADNALVVSRICVVLR